MKTIHPKITREELHRLHHEEQLSPTTIGRLRGFHKDTIRNWLGFYDISYDRNVGVEQIRASNLIQPNLNPTPALAYILGVLLGDGFVTRYKHSYTIGLAVQDKSFAESFVNALKEIGLNPNLYPTGPYPGYNGPTYRVNAHSKIFQNWYKSLCFNQIMEIISKSSLSKQFIRGFYESEGSCGLYGKLYSVWTISMSNTDKNLLEFVLEKLKIFDFHLHLYRIGITRIGKEFYQIKKSMQWDNCQRFFNVFKPCIKNPTLLEAI